MSPGLWATAGGLPVPSVAGDSDLIDTLSGALILATAVGIVAVVLIAVSRRREASVTLTEALATPPAALAVGTAILSLWVSTRASAIWAPAGVIMFVLAAFQAQLAFALLRPGLRETGIRAGLIINVIALLVWVFVNVVGAPVSAAVAASEPLTGTDIALAAFELVQVGLLGFVISSDRAGALARRRVTSTRMVEIRSFAVATVTLLTFLAVAGIGHAHA